MKVWRRSKCRHKNIFVPFRWCQCRRSRCCLWRGLLCFHCCCLGCCCEAAACSNTHIHTLLNNLLLGIDPGEDQLVLNLCVSETETVGKKVCPILQCWEIYTIIKTVPSIESAANWIKMSKTARRHLVLDQQVSTRCHMKKGEQKDGVPTEGPMKEAATEKK